MKFKQILFLTLLSISSFGFGMQNAQVPQVQGDQAQVPQVQGPQVQRRNRLSLSINLDEVLDQFDNMRTSIDSTNNTINGLTLKIDEIKRWADTLLRSQTVLKKFILNGTCGATMVLGLWHIHRGNNEKGLLLLGAGIIGLLKADKLITD